MIINPLNETKNKYDVNEKEPIYINNEKIINDIVEYILEKHSSTLSQIAFENKNKVIIENIVKERLMNNYPNINNEIILKDVLDRFFGYYILQKHIDNENITDIRVINYNTIYVKEKGIWKKTKDSFNEDKEYLNFVRYCILKNGGKINNEEPMVVVSDKNNNLRIEAGIEPVNILSPNLVIRIHRPNKLKTLEDLFMAESYMFNFKIYILLVKLMVAGVNIVISGKGASGKTTLLRALINTIPSNVSITSNEETAELFCKHDNIIQREIVQNRTEDKKITLEKLSKECLVMSNDAIIVGELKGQETMMFLDAIATGHRGYATVHSNNSQNTISRLVTLMKRDLKANQYTPEFLEQLLSNSVEVIIYMQNFKIKEIVEIGYDNDKNKIIYNILYEFKVLSIIENKLNGFFLKKNELKFGAKEKIELSRYEIEKIMEVE